MLKKERILQQTKKIATHKSSYQLLTEVIFI